MTMTRTAGATTVALALMLGAAATAVAQSATQDPHHQTTPGAGPHQGMMMDPDAMQEMMRQMMTQGRMGQGMGMMQQMPGMGQMPQGQMSPGMGQGMMGPGMGQGMMQQMPGTMGQGMMGGWRITPVMHLGIEDVQHSLEHFIEAHELQHLKVGEVRETDDDTITADIVTQEGSLALQLEVDRHTGLVRKLS